MKAKFCGQRFSAPHHSRYPLFPSLNHIAGHLHHGEQQLQPRHGKEAPRTRRIAFLHMLRVELFLLNGYDKALFNMRLGSSPQLPRCSRRSRISLASASRRSRGRQRGLRLARLNSITLRSVPRFETWVLADCALRQKLVRRRQKRSFSPPRRMLPVDPWICSSI